MQFIIQPFGQPVHVGAEAVVLEADGWDDMGFRTTFNLWYRNPTDLRNLGPVKVAWVGQERGPNPLQPGVYTGLPEGEVFSLGQSDIYYDNIRKLGSATRTAILHGLGDLAFDLDWFDAAQAHEVTRESLLRMVDEQTVRVQYHRIARGGVRLSEYRFSYLGPGQDPDSEISFHVRPETRPSSNIHVLVGRNGVGKTTLLRRLAGAVVHPDLHEMYGRVTMAPTSTSAAGERFVNVVSVTFSAFDPFATMQAPGRPGVPLPPNGVAYQYVGLKASTERTGGLETTQHERLCSGFHDALVRALESGRIWAWCDAMKTLSRDPRFADTAIAAYAEELRAGSRIMKSHLDALRQAFEKLSSGHAIVVLTLTELVGLVVEQSLVILDEPETHLHPPLLASFVQALSELLTDRNGVAVIATHSPVVLQTVPRSCVYKLIRHGETSRAEQPQIETYGENVGVLTHEVFGLEVMQSGFYKDVTDAVERFDSYEDVLAHFSGQLGSEAKGLVHVLLADKVRGRS
ncbi:AAA family ATPase [Streptomyces sp. NRRL F-2747]|uniref:AAA family ATPase n=1 Tax=Streptomyces sp. NRRL F-2747 TaxID=1463843 RepID=UPI0004CBC59C|nr:AAA family ATPase [Streptomyces sp. NRRL F-2747]